jgi:hypothetical protein
LQPCTRVFDVSTSKSKDTREARFRDKNRIEDKGDNQIVIVYDESESAADIQSEKGGGEGEKKRWEIKRENKDIVVDINTKTKK